MSSMEQHAREIALNLNKVETPHEIRERILGQLEASGVKKRSDDRIFIKIRNVEGEYGGLDENERGILVWKRVSDGAGSYTGSYVVVPFGDIDDIKVTVLPPTRG